MLLSVIIQYVLLLVVGQLTREIFFLRSYEAFCHIIVTNIMHTYCPLDKAYPYGVVGFNESISD